MNNTCFKNKKPNFAKLLKFGFEENKDGYKFVKSFLDNQFELTVEISKSGKIKTKVIEVDFGEEYTLHLVQSAEGTFVGKVREEYDKILNSIEEECFDNDVFKYEMTKKLIDYVTKKYGDEIECLWEKFPDNGIFRRKDTQKWYAAILTVKRNKFGFKSDESVEVVDLRVPAEDMEIVLSNKNVYPGYHMNKKHWISIILDGSMPLKDICRFVDNSYILAVK